MKTKSIKKVLSLILSLFMFVSMFTCFSGLTASAAASDTQMLHASASTTGRMFGWRCTTATNPLAKGVKYRLSLDWENVSNAPFGSSMFAIYCYSGAWRNIFNNSTYCSEWNVTSNQLAHGNHYDIDFTLKSSLSECREFVLYFGDIGKSISSYEFNTAKFVLYTRDDSDNLTDTGKTFSFPVTFRAASDNAMNSYINSYTGTDRGQLWTNYSGSSFTREFVDIPSGYFDAVSEPEPEPVVPEYVHFEEARNNYSRFIYRSPYTTRPAGNYRFTMDCKIFSGTPTINVGGDDITNVPNAAFKNYTATYDEENYKYIITFTFDEPFTGSDRICALIGNYGTDGNFVCANPELYLLDGSGQPTGSNLFNTFATDFYSSSSASEKWERRGNYTCKTLPDHYFDKESTNNYAAHFTSGSDNYQVVAYKDNAVYVNAGTVYRLKIDINNTSATDVEPSVQLRTGSDIGTSYTGTLISTNGFERVYEFTVSSNGAGIGMFIGNYGKGTDLDFAFRNPRLYTYKNDTYGTTNILTPFGADNFDRGEWGYKRDTAPNGKWFPINCSGTLLQYGEDDGSYFQILAPAEPQIIRFPKGYNNYQMLAYRGGALTAGKYRFTVDEFSVNGTKSTVSLWVNANYASAVEKVDGSDVLNGMSRTVEFQLWGDKDSFVLMMGNYGQGSDMELYYKNPALYKLDGGEPTGSNLLENYNTNNVVLQGGLGKTTAVSGKWSSLNWAEGYIESLDPEISYNGGDYNIDGKTSSADLVRYKNALIGTAFTPVSLNTNGDTSVDVIDYKALVNVLLNSGVVGKLQNTYNKLAYDKKLKIGYFGGSVTGGTGSSSDEYRWSSLTTARLSAQFPDAEITEVNMGLGGTGSYMGAARFKNNIVDNNPDLVFIDCAINDRYNGISAEQTKQDVEYMIRKLNASNPYADIVIALVTDRDVIGTRFTSYAAIKEVADFYNIPVVDMGAAMYNTLGGSVADWDNYYADIVHPNDAGHAVYADAVTELFGSALIDAGRTAHTLPDTYVSANPVTSVTLLTRDTFEPFKWGHLDDNEFGANYWHASDDYEKSNSPFRFALDRCFKEMKKYIYPKHDGAEVEFTVTGKSIGILGSIKKDQSLDVIIDGNSVTLNGDNKSAMTEYPIACNLTDTEHTVKLVAHGDGPYIAIAAVAVGR